MPSSALDVALLNADGLTARIHRYVLFCVKDGNGSVRYIVRTAPREEPCGAIIQRLGDEIPCMDITPLGGGEFSYRPHDCNIILFGGTSPDIEREDDRAASAAIFQRALGFHTCTLP